MLFISHLSVLLTPGFPSQSYWHNPGRSSKTSRNAAFCKLLMVWSKPKLTHLLLVALSRTCVLFCCQYQYFGFRFWYIHLGPRQCWCIFNVNLTI